MNKHAYPIAGACLALLLASGPLGAQLEGPQLDLASFPQSRLTVHGANGDHEFQIWTRQHATAADARA